MKLLKVLNTLEYAVLAGRPYLDSADIEDIVYDSRKARNDNLFVCLVGANTDGHRYALKACEQGCRMFVVQDGVQIPEELLQTEGILVVSVPDTRAALAVMSDNFFDHPSSKLKVIGITGTKGKTTTTHIIKSVLDSLGYSAGLIGTVGAVWGEKRVQTVNTTPESYETQKLLYQMANDGVKAVAMEVSSLGVKSHRVDHIKFFCGVFTNISPDHIGGNEHASYEEYYSCKKMFFNMCETAVGCIDDAATEDMLSAVSGRKIYYGFDANAEFRAANVSSTRSGEFLGTGFDFFQNGENKGRCEISIPGYFSAHNALAALSVVSLLGVPFASACPALRTVQVSGRSQIVYMSDDFGIIIDYAHNGVSLKSIIETMRDYKPKRIISLFGTVGGRAQVRREELGRVAAVMSDYTILTADDPDFEDPEAIAKEVAGYLVAENPEAEYTIIPDRAEAIDFAVGMLVPGDMLLLCGKGHEKFMKVNGEKIPFDEIECVKSALKKRDIN